MARTQIAVIAALAVLAAAPGAGAAEVTDGAGPITRLAIGPDLECTADYAGDADPVFYTANFTATDGLDHTACGTFLAFDGALAGPLDIPASNDTGPRTPFTPVAQTTSGTGTGTDPHRIETVVDAFDGALRVTQVDVLVDGQNAWRTTTTVTNTTAEPVEVVLYHAADCYLQDSDWGFGAVDAATGAVGCVSGIGSQLEPEAAVPGDRLQQFVPLSPGSAHLEAHYGDIWQALKTTAPLPSTCECDVFQDNAMALSWTLSIPAGGSASRSRLTNLSPAGLEPIATALAADVTTVAAGGPVTYTVTLTNPNVVDVTVTSVEVLLPAGFTTPPAATAGPVVVPANGTATVVVAALAGTTPGAFTASVEGRADPIPVLPTTDAASVTVLAPVVAEPTTSSSTTSSTTNTSTTSTSTTSASTTSTTGAPAVLSAAGGGAARASAPAALARTGVEPGALAAAALAALAVGLVATAESRRRLALRRLPVRLR